MLSYILKHDVSIWMLKPNWYYQKNETVLVEIASGAYLWIPQTFEVIREIGRENLSTLTEVPHTTFAVTY